MTSRARSETLQAHFVTDEVQSCAMSLNQKHESDVISMTPSTSPLPTVMDESEGGADLSGRPLVDFWEGSGRRRRTISPCRVRLPTPPGPGSLLPPSARTIHERRFDLNKKSLLLVIGI
jgi:hypothetical protein